MKTGHVIPQIGLAMPRPDAWPKVRGEAVFAADHFPENLLWAGVKRALAPHARLIGIEIATAAEIPGVLKILTHRDVPGPNRQGIAHKDQPVLAADKVRRAGDPAALVLAETREALDAALKAIAVKIDPLPAVFDPESALAENAPLVHEDQGSNLLAEVLIDKGDILAGFAESDRIVEGVFTVPRQEHAYLETEAGWARMLDDGRIELTAGTQSPFRDRHEVASALGLPLDRVKIIAPFIGGGFGGKDGASVQTLLALAALHSNGRPVKMVWDREESFLAGVKRVPARMEYRVGAKSDGTLHALSARILMDAGAYDHLCGEVLALAAEHAGGAYRIPHVSIEARSAYTNNPPGGPFRGFGVPQVTAAVEQMMDELANATGLDPLAFRLKNCLRRGDRTPAGVTLTNSIGLEECLKKLENHPLWQDREPWMEGAGPHKRRGVGLACLSQGVGYGPVVADCATAKIALAPDGRFLVDAAVSDMGQGNAGTYLQIAGDILNQHIEDLEAILPDTDRTLPSCSSSASRTTYTYGNALMVAARQLERRILEYAAVIMMAGRWDEFALLPGRVRHLPSGRELPLAKLAAMMPTDSRISTHYWRAPSAGEKINARLKSAVGIPHIVFSYAAHLARVEVDELTGGVRVTDYLAATDCGRVLNPQSCEQQIQGGIVQGLGYALAEDYPVRDGLGLKSNLTTYILPTAVDAPDIVAIPVETYEATGPYGQKGVGEIPINGPLPAAANAVAEACGDRIFDAPLTPERVMSALAASERRPK